MDDLAPHRRAGARAASTPSRRRRRRAARGSTSTTRGGRARSRARRRRRRRRSRTRRRARASTSGLPAPPRPKRKSRPTSTVRTPSASDEHVLDELARGQVRELLVESEHERRVDAGLGEQLQLLVDADEVLGADLGPQQRQRVAVERDRDDAGAAGGGIHPRPIDHRAVAGVHAVELADRDDRRAEARGHLGRVAEDDHGATAAAAASVCRDGSRGTMGDQPPQPEERQHERHEEVAPAEPRPHGRVGEQLGHHEAQRADDEDADQLEHDRDPRDAIPAAGAREDRARASRGCTRAPRAPTACRRAGPRRIARRSGRSERPVAASAMIA